MFVPITHSINISLFWAILAINITQSAVTFDEYVHCYGDNDGGNNEPEERLFGDVHTVVECYTARQQSYS